MGEAQMKNDGQIDRERSFIEVRTNKRFENIGEQFEYSYGVNIQKPITILTHYGFTFENNIFGTLEFYPIQH